MKQSCTVGSRYLGLPENQIHNDWSNGSKKDCSYYQQVDDPDYPSTRLKVCGNCTHYIIVEDKE